MFVHFSHKRILIQLFQSTLNQFLLSPDATPSIRRFDRVQERQTIRKLQFAGVIVARRPESNHFWTEKADSAAIICSGGTYKTALTS